MYLSKVLVKFTSFNGYSVLIVTCTILFVIYNFKENFQLYKSEIKYTVEEAKGVKDLHNDIIEAYLSRRTDWPTSNLGSILYKNVTTVSMGQKNSNTKKYKVLVWKYWNWLKNRHVYNYDAKRNKDINILSDCSVKNCVFTGDDDDISNADAVVIHIQHGIYPNITTRNRNQRWVFLSDESPTHAFSMANIKPTFSQLANIFNWSMTYRSDSDVPVPYGRTVPLPKPLLSHVSDRSINNLVPYWKEKRRDILATILISNCGVSRRMNYLKELEKHLPLDIYGGCSKNHKNVCPGHFKSDCNIIAKYLFYLVFENSECREYLTEKGFYNAYSKGAIPIIMGPSTEECKSLLPPYSYLHVDDYKSPEELAKFVLNLNKDIKRILDYHQWRNHFDVINEHGYFGSKSFHYCRVCEALNYNSKEEKIINEQMLRSFLDPSLSCRNQ